MGKIGIMGGTFDPIHNGHLRLGEQAFKEYCLDEVWYMPSGNPPHKKDHQVSDASVRFEMTSLAIEGHKEFICSDFEVTRKGNTYTAKTLRLLHEAFPQHTFYFIVGADSIYEIETWYEPEQVMAQSVLLAACREYQEAPVSLEQQMDYLARKYRADIRLLHCTEMNVSSAALRQMAANGQSIAQYVPEKVFQYICTHGLYQK